MKNKIISITIFFAAACSFYSCKKILESKIPDQFSETNFPKTESDIRSAITPLYSNFTTDWGFTDPGSGVWTTSIFVASESADFFTRIMTDEQTNYWNSPIADFIIGPSSWRSTDYQSLYSRIRIVSRATDLIDKIGKTTIAESVKGKFLAEVKTLRAWYMFLLYDSYGPLNFKLDPATLTSNKIEPRMTNEACFAAMENDLLDAINSKDFPDKYNDDANNWGHVSKGVARMVLLKLYMQGHKWSDAKTVAESIRDMGYSLESSYKEVFTKKANNELIYAIPENGSLYNYWYKVILPSDASKVLGISVQADGWLGGGIPWSHYDKYASGDKRLETITDFYVNTNGDTIKRPQLFGAIPLKYTNYLPFDKSFEYVIYRYSDVLLSLAEIDNELNGPTSEAINYAKEVTDRAGTTIPAGAIASKDAFRDFILDERGRELYWEPYIRRQDLIRHNKFISGAQARGKTSAEDFMVLFPIPSDVVIESNGVIVQNPGYI